MDRWETELAGAALAALALLAPAAGARADDAMAAKVEALVARPRGLYRPRHGDVRRAGRRRRHRQPATSWSTPRASAAAARAAAIPSTPASRVPDRLDDQGVPRHHACHRRRPRQARLGRPGGRPLPGLPAQGPVGDARIPRHRPDGAALRPAGRGQRRGRPARLRPGGDDPVAAPRRAGLELPQHLHLHEHHPHADRAHRGAGDGRRELGGAGRRRDLRRRSGWATPR